MDDVYAIRLAKTELREAFRAGSVNRVLAVFGDGFADMSGGQASFFGPEASAVLRHRLKKLFASYRAHLAVTIISISVQGAMAFDWGWHTLTLTPKKRGRTTVTRTRYLEIWQKDSEGRWRIGIFFDNPDLPPKMPPKEVLAAMGKRQAQDGRRRKSA